MLSEAKHLPDSEAKHLPDSEAKHLPDEETLRSAQGDDHLLSQPLKVSISQCRYQAMIGAGGIGAGLFFALNGEHTLGREESRSGRFLERRDYCKLHIISHYVKTLLGSEFEAILIGRVGADDDGRRLLAEMQATGLDTRHVPLCPGEQTMLSICLVYPDGSGGNLTVDDSACNRVDAAFVAAAEADFARFAGRGVALAAPEVPLAARGEVLRLGSAYGFLRVASFTSGEMRAAADPSLRSGGLLAQVDVLGINLDEAAAIAGLPAHADRGKLQPPQAIIEASLERLLAINPAMLVAITAGKDGSWSWDGANLAHLPALPARLVSTAGAGDAHLAGVIAGLVAGLPMAQAHELGALVAGLSVTSPHTIHPGIDRRSLREFAQQSGAPLSAAVREMLEE